MSKNDKLTEAERLARKLDRYQTDKMIRDQQKRKS